MKTEFQNNVWTEDIAFYLAGVSFIHEYHPLDQARTPRGISSFLYRKRFALRIRRALSEMFRGNKLWERRYTTLLTGTTLAH